MFVIIMFIFSKTKAFVFEKTVKQPTMQDTDKIATWWRLLRDKALERHYNSLEQFVDTVNVMVQKLPSKSLRKTLSKYHDDVCDIFGLPPDPYIDEDENGSLSHNKIKVTQHHHLHDLTLEDNTRLSSAAGKETLKVKKVLVNTLC